MASKGISRKDGALDVRDAKAPYHVQGSLSQVKGSHPGKRIFSTLGTDGSTTYEPGLPSQVVSRREHKAPKAKEDPKKPELKKIDCDPKRINALRQEAKEEWLDRALKAIPEGRATVQDIFEVVTNPKFPSGVDITVGRAMLNNVTDSYFFFSEKQRDTIEKCKLADKFGGGSDSDGDDYDADRGRSSKRSKKSRYNDDADSAGHSHDEERESRVRKHSSRKEEEKKRMMAAMEEERLRKAEQKKEMEAMKKALEEKEKRRKAKIGSAFIDDDEDDEAPQVPKKTGSDLGKLPQVDRSLRSSFSDPNQVWTSEALGGNAILSEAHTLLAKAAGAYGKRPKSPEVQESTSHSRRRVDSRERGGRRSDSRERVRRQRSRSRRRYDSRERDRPSRAPPVSGSRQFQSDRPQSNAAENDGQGRGRMRAARKAKMIQQLMGKP